MQIFRSIDSNSVKGFPKEPKDASSKVNKRFKCFKFSFSCLISIPDLSHLMCHYESVKHTVFLQNLVCGKNVLIDMSIHTAYVKAIRSAQHYIYIENQYFIGSSYNWSQHKDLGMASLSAQVLLVASRIPLAAVMKSLKINY